MISCYYDIVLRKRKGWKNIMKKQVKIIGGVAAVAVIATASFFALGAREKKAPEKEISLSEKAKTLTEGESFTLKVKNGDSKTSARSKDEDIASVEKIAKTKADYKVTGVKAGTTEIVFKKASKDITCKVTVNAKSVPVDKTTVQSSQNKVSQSKPSNTNNGTPTGSSSHNAAISKSQSKNSVQSSNTPRKTNTPSNASRKRSDASSNRRTPSTQSSQNNNARQNQSKSGRNSDSSGNSVTTKKTGERKPYGNDGNYYEDYEGFSGHDDWTAIDDND